jgi:PIN domain nuclease of toxin-antitoxin system
VDFLLDTHSFIWFLQGSEKLSIQARDIIENDSNKLYLSIASVWEIAIKLNLGKLKMDLELEDLKIEIFKNNIELLALDFEHLITLTKFNLLHRDPFDRIIISQGLSEKLCIITKDLHFKLYTDVNLIW